MFSKQFRRFVSSMPRLTLYKQNASPPSCAVMMTTDILGLNVDYKEPALLEGEHKSPEFRKINPMGTIPVLQDGDFVVSESHAIIKYLVEKYGSTYRSTLYPADLEVRAKIDECLYFDAGVFFIKLKNVALPTLMKGLSGPSEEQLAEIDDAYSTVELYLGSKPYLVGEHYTVADLCVGSTAAAMQPIHALDGEKFPNTKAWLDRLEKESFFQKVTVPGVARFGKLLNMFWENNKSKSKM